MSETLGVLRAIEELSARGEAMVSASIVSTRGSTYRREGPLRPSAADRAKIHGPAGLDIGAEGPDEIAWAIVAELLAVDRDRPGGFLRDRPGPIHERRTPPEPAVAR